jgi:hypothetical protein
MCTRVDPATSVDIIRDAWTADLDPRVAPEKREAGDLTVGRMLINACKPFAWRDQFPKTNVFNAEQRKIVENRWSQLLANIGAKKSGERTFTTK